MAVLEVEQPKKVFFNTGAELQTIGLNGQRLYRQEGGTGGHAGKERIPAELRKGRNTIIIETGRTFFVSATDDHTW